MLEFTTAVKEVAEEDQDPGLPFTVDGKQLRAFKPGDGQLAYLMAALGRGQSMPEQMAGAINFFVETLEGEDQDYIINRLLDRKDPFGVQELEAILRGLIEEWTGRPTQPSSGSTPSPPNTGPSSTLTTTR